jgi:hypothetical protein
VNQASGWNYFGVGDILDAHNYPDPVCPTSASQAVACGEFGGVWLGVAGHTWSPSPGDVSPAQASTTVASQFEALGNELPDLIQNHGMSAAVYTEISDVEIELAGLRTFDRKLLKPNLSRMQMVITSLTGVPIITNTPPVLAALSNVTITAGQLLLVTNFASDSDIPAQSLTWNLASKPVGATIDASGIILWRPTISQSPSTNAFKVVVTDTGVPSMSATQSFSVTVTRPVAPTFASPIIVSGTFRSVVSGSVGPDYSVYASTNLANSWQLLLQTNPIALPFEFVDPNFTNFQQRFYRVILGP